jgi:hypothetical protein
VKKTYRRSMALSLIAFPVALVVSKPAKAFAFLPFLWTAFKVLVGNGIRAVVTAVAPSVMSSTMGKFLVSVAIAYGVSEAQAAIFANKAETSGSKTIAKGGLVNDVEIAYENPTNHTVEIRGGYLELVDLTTGEVEQSQKLPYFLVEPRKSESFQFTVKKFKSEGTKVLRLSYQNQVLASSQKFYGIL